MHASGEHISLETEIPVEGEHIPTVHTEEHISAGRGQGYVFGETHITGEHITGEHISALHGTVRVWIDVVAKIITLCAYAQQG